MTPQQQQAEQQEQQIVKQQADIEAEAEHPSPADLQTWEADQQKDCSTFVPTNAEMEWQHDQAVAQADKSGVPFGG